MVLLNSADDFQASYGSQKSIGGLLRSNWNSGTIKSAQLNRW